MGTCNVMMWLVNRTLDYNWDYYFVGVYCWTISVLIYMYENLCGGSRKAGKCLPYRAIVYMGCAIPLFYTSMTIMTGFFLVCVSAANFMGEQMLSF